MSLLMRASYTLPLLAICPGIVQDIWASSTGGADSPPVITPYESTAAPPPYVSPYVSPPPGQPGQVAAELVQVWCVHVLQRASRVNIERKKKKRGEGGGVCVCG